jgi:hypothetical protein
MVAKWFWADSRESMDFQGPFGCKEDAIDDGRSEREDCEGSIFVGVGTPVDPGEVMANCFDVDSALEWASERAYEDEMGGEWVEDWLPHYCPKEAEAEFREFLKGWARKHFPVSYYIVGSKGLEEVPIHV